MELEEEDHEKRDDAKRAKSMPSGRSSRAYDVATERLPFWTPQAWQLVARQRDELFVMMLSHPGLFDASVEQQTHDRCQGADAAELGSILTQVFDVIGGLRERGASRLQAALRGWCTGQGHTLSTPACRDAILDAYLRADPFDKENPTAPALLDALASQQPQLELAGAVLARAHAAASGNESRTWFVTQALGATLRAARLDTAGRAEVLLGLLASVQRQLASECVRDSLSDIIGSFEPANVLVFTQRLIAHLGRLEVPVLLAVCSGLAFAALADVTDRAAFRAIVNAFDLLVRATSAGPAARRTAVSMGVWLGIAAGLRIRDWDVDCFAPLARRWQLGLAQARKSEGKQAPGSSPAAGQALEHALFGASAAADPLLLLGRADLAWEDQLGLVQVAWKSQASHDSASLRSQFVGILAELGHRPRAQVRQLMDAFANRCPGMLTRSMLKQARLAWMQAIQVEFPGGLAGA